jgi:DNA topoisomerase-2
MSTKPNTKTNAVTELTIEERYDKKTHHEHILIRPDSYVGSIETDVKQMWIFDDETQKMIKKDITFVPGLYKIYDEILVNARDHCIRDNTCTTIKVTINSSTGEITVFNDGNGVPIQLHSKHNIYVAELIFGNLLSGENFAEADKIVGGRNGYGAKLANIFSKYFCVETVDSASKKKYVQVFTNNMYNIEAPTITNITPKIKPYTQISFIPDFSRFGIEGLTADVIALFKKRVYDIAACTSKNVKVYFNEELIKTQTFKNYIELFYNEYPSDPIYEEVGERWKVCAFFDSNAGFNHVSFVNGISTYKGGTHLNYISDQIVQKLLKYINEKHKGVPVKSSLIRDNLTLFIDSVIVNPVFDSQTKEFLTTKTAQFGSTCELSEDFIKNLTKTGIVEEVVNMAKFKEMSELRKIDGKKTQSVKGIAKYEQAKYAGTKQSHKCGIILTEGDSAKAFGLAGIELIGNDYYGIFPLKGKPLNVREATVKQLLTNEEFINLVKILGLKQNKKYTTTKGLNYGKIIILTDQDVDGYHIRGLLINLIHYFWPSLLKVEEFIQIMTTPILKAFKTSDTNKKNPKIFYSIPEYKIWDETGESKGYEVKYYKGLGTSTEEEAKESFMDFKNRLLTLMWDEPDENTNMVNKNNSNEQDHNSNEVDEDNDEKEDKEEKEDNDENDEVEDDDINDLISKSYDAITLAFQKNRANDRKVWLFNFNDKNILDETMKNITYSDFVHKQLIFFSHEDNIRSIPSICDGLKPSQRKILFAGFKRNLDKKEIKVAQFSGYISETTEYHHGEASLHGAIIGMAQNFIGSNNVNLLMPNGNFGNRRAGGKDAASPRYIFTQLNPVTMKMFIKEDENIYDYVIEEGMSIEPIFYAPIIATILINGASGIGTGFSTDIPPHNPLDLIENTRRMLDGLDPKQMMPWFRGFEGKITGTKDGRIVSIGKYEVINEQEIRITELPIGTWTDKYKEFLDGLLVQDKNDTDKNHILVKYHSNSGNNKVDITLTFAGNNLQHLLKEGKIEKRLKLIAAIQSSNMYLYNSKGHITKYETVDEILVDFYKYRLQMYSKRKEYMLKLYRNQADIYKYRVEFINKVTSDEIILKNKSDAYVEKVLEDLQFPRMVVNIDKGEDKADYEYLLSMRISTFTNEKRLELQKKYEEKLLELKMYENTSIQDMWRKELDEFEQVYKTWLDKMDGNDIVKKGKNKAIKKGDNKKITVKAKTTKTLK